MDAQLDALLDAARRARAQAYAPYSRYQVGAAILAEDGRIFQGANMENSAYPTCLCAEHNALGTAVSSGARGFRAVAVVTELDAHGRPGSPCGQCRQALSEFGLDWVVLLAGPSGPPVRTTLRELLPHAFSGEQLG